MGVDLKYNLEEYAAAKAKIVNLKTTIENNKNTMINSLEILRNDWTLDGGVEFFKSVDDTWSDGIQNCIDVLDDLIDALDKAYKEYEKIEPEANRRFNSF